MEWIPVNARLPEESGTYFVIHEKVFKVPMMVYWDSKRKLFIYTTEQVNRLCVFAIQATHWIQIPNVPGIDGDPFI